MHDVNYYVEGDVEIIDEKKGDLSHLYIYFRVDYFSLAFSNPENIIFICAIEIKLLINQ